MCSIIGLINSNNSNKKIKLALAILKNRGKDSYGLATSKATHHAKTLSTLPNTNDNILLGHTLHSVVGHMPQPIKQIGTLISNCEIYNWKELNQKYNLKAKNDSDLLLKFLDKFQTSKLDELDGVFAFAYLNNNTLTLARDIIGIKPIWYFYNQDELVFASEKKALEKIGYQDIKELNPRQIIQYNTKTKQIKFTNREFFQYLPEHKATYKTIKANTAKLLDQAIEKRIPKKKFGLLFSGGIDSTFIAKTLKDKGYDFTCYTAALDTTTAVPKDLESAKKVAKELGLKLKIKTIKLEQVPSYLKKIVPLIEDSNVVKVGVALTFYLACELAKKDGCKVIFSGLGSEEIFAGYDRHKKSANINQECLAGLRKMYERDLYRDDVLTMDNNLELRVPLLDKQLVQYALKIPDKYKIKDNLTKFILRDIAIEKEINKEFATRKKQAAQYGSRLDNALTRLARKNKQTKSQYVKQFYPTHNLNLGILYSSGKDSTSAALIMKKQNYNLSCLITMQSKNNYSYMFQSAGINMVKLQAKAMNIPLIIQKTKGEKELELLDLKKAIQKAKTQFKIDAIVTGALFSTYQRDRIEKIAEDLGLKVFSPLWHKSQEQHMKEAINNDIKFIITAIAADGLDKSWLKKEITLKELEELKKFHKKNKLNIAGEGGEFESLVIDCPLFEKKIQIEESKKVMDSICSGYLEITKAKLVNKQ